MALDRSKPFGEVFGIADHKYVQDGRKFDHEGNELGGKAPAPAKSGKAEKQQPQEADQVGTQLAQ